MKYIYKNLQRRRLHKQPRTSVSIYNIYIFIHICYISYTTPIFTHRHKDRNRLYKNTILRLYFCTLVTPTTSPQDSRQDNNSSPPQHIAADYTITKYLTTAPDKTYTIQDTIHTPTPATTTTNTCSIPTFTLQLHTFKCPSPTISSSYSQIFTDDTANKKGIGKRAQSPLCHPTLSYATTQQERIRQTGFHHPYDYLTRPTPPKSPNANNNKTTVATTQDDGRDQRQNSIPTTQTISKTIYTTSSIPISAPAPDAIAIHGIGLPAVLRIGSKAVSGLTGRSKT